MHKLHLMKQELKLTISDTAAYGRILKSKLKWYFNQRRFAIKSQLQNIHAIAKRVGI